MPTAMDESLIAAKKASQWIAGALLATTSRPRCASTLRSSRRPATTHARPIAAAARTTRSKTSATGPSATSAAISEINPQQTASPASAAFHRIPGGTLHAVGRLDSDQVEPARDHGLGRTTEPGAGGPGGGAEPLWGVVEGLEVVRDAHEVGRDRVRAAPL